MTKMDINLVSIQGHSGLMVEYAIHFQLDEVKQCTRSLVQSSVKSDVFLKFYFNFTSLEV